MCEKFMLGKDIVFCISVRGMGEQDCVPSGSDWVLWGLGFLSWYGERLENKVGRVQVRKKASEPFQVRLYYA